MIRHWITIAALVALLGGGAATAVGAPWRDRLDVAGLTAPAVRGGTPFLALLDTPADVTRPAFAAGNLSLTASLEPYDLHGTATAAIAGGVASPIGVWPGMRIVEYPFRQDGLTCEDSADVIARATADGAAVISMSYGSDQPCFPELAAIQEATRRGVIVVAAAGNERLANDPREYPATDPHVVTAAALDAAGNAAAFSSSSRAVDVAAPGVGVETAVPLAFDPDGVVDGLASLDGTSFSAPMVAAAATWLRAARPRLTGGQVAALLCASARDVGARGWDPRTGCGAIDVAAALRRPAARADVAEPNDNVIWVDGVGIGRPSRIVWHGGRPATIRAWVTQQDDSIDVYRVRIPAHTRVQATLTPGADGADLRILDRGAVDVADRSAWLGVSHRRARAVDRTSAANRTSSERIAYVVVTHDDRGRAHTVPYRLVIARG